MEKDLINVKCAETHFMRMDLKNPTTYYTPVLNHTNVKLVENHLLERVILLFIIEYTVKKDL